MRRMIATPSVAASNRPLLSTSRLQPGTPLLADTLRVTAEVTLANDCAGIRLLPTIGECSRPVHPLGTVQLYAPEAFDAVQLTSAEGCAQKLTPATPAAPLVMVPEMVWDLCTQKVIVMERMKGVPISQTERLRAAGVDIPKLARDGVTIFFTQVFRDGFFHADMHPGNIFVATEGPTRGRYIALDFGIIGTLNDVDKNYLATNFLAFFQRDYRRVALAHIEAGWVPAHTRVDEFEGAIRAVCEPIFDRPLKDISFGKTLLRLFQTARRFEMEVQPQLVLLQKTLLNIEGLGRQLDPDLDLWKTAKPFLERWMNDQMGWRALLRHARDEAPAWAAALPQLPRLVHQALSAPRNDDTRAELARLTAEARRNTIWLITCTLLLSCLAALEA